MPLDDKNNDLKNDLANVKKAQKNQGYRDRLYSSSGIIIEGPEKQKEKSVENTITICTARRHNVHWEKRDKSFNGRAWKAV